MDLARCHEQALMTLVSSGGLARNKQAVIARAKTYFAETLVPLEKTHRAAMKADIRVHQLTKTLRRCTKESSASIRHLKRSIIQRQRAEAALKKSGKQHAKLLAEAHRLQEHLRHLTHTSMSAQEDERQTTSRRLHDEIAQTLLGIHVRLLTLKKAAKANTGNIKKEIADTQRLVMESVKTIHRAAGGFGILSGAHQRPS